MKYAAPGRPAVPVDVVRAALVAGRCGECCVCAYSCVTWWDSPGGCVPVHDRCVVQLYRERAPEPVASGVVTAKRSGAYARFTPSVVVAVPRAGRTPEALPAGFTPGAFWRPGDSADVPWTVVAVTAAGLSVGMPAATRESAERDAGRLELRGETGERVPVVGAVMVAPDGTWSPRWGQHGEAPGRLDTWVRCAALAVWRAVMREADWWRCAGCDEWRWPGMWRAVTEGLCLGCLRSDGREAGRPELREPSRPRDEAWPEWVTAAPKKLALPKGFKRRG